MGFLYILDFGNGKSYVGLTTKTPEHRYLCHQRSAKHSSLAVHRAWRKHGAPSMKVLAQVEDYDLAACEVRAIKSFGTLVPNGYNLGPGGEVSPMKNPLVSQKVAAKLKGKVGTFLGKKHSEASKEKSRLSKLGKKHSAEHRAKIAAGGIGRKTSDLTKQRISLANTGKPRSPEYRAKIAASLTKEPLASVPAEIIGWAANGKAVYSTCKRGHLLAGDNLIERHEGKYRKRSCRECQRLRMQQCREKKRNEGAPMSSTKQSSNCKEQP